MNGINFILTVFLSFAALPKAYGELPSSNTPHLEITRREIPYDPFTETVDPASGNRVAPGTEITVSLPGSSSSTKRMTAKEYLDELNKIQKKLNRIGYSLKSKKDADVLSKVNIDQAIFQAQIAKTTAELLDLDEETMKKPNPIASYFEDKEKSTKEKINKILNKVTNAVADSADVEAPEVKFEPVDEEKLLKPNPDLVNALDKTWRYEAGDKSIAGVEAIANIKMGGKRRQIDAFADAEANAYVLTLKGNLLKAQAKTGFLHKDKDNSNGYVYTYVVILGAKIESLSMDEKPKDDSWNSKDLGDRAFEKVEEISQSYNFTIGPIPVSAKIGAKSQVYYDWGIGFEMLKAAASVEIGAASGVFAQAGIDAGIANVGFRGDLTIIDFAVKASGFIEQTKDPETKEEIMVAEVLGTLDLTSLKGKFAAVASIWTPLPTPGIKEFEHILFEFPAFVRENGKVLFNLKRTTSTTGIKLEGAPQSEDYEGIPLAESLQKTINEVGQIAGEQKTLNAIRDLREHNSQLKALKESLADNI